jgi:hypothetical protein
MSVAGTCGDSETYAIAALAESTLRPRAGGGASASRAGGG